MGLSREDFCSLTVEEFDAVMELYEENETAKYRDRWERARMIAYSAVAPHSKKIRQATDLVRFPWEEKKLKGERKKEKVESEVPKMTKEEHHRRIQELEKMWG